MCETGACGLSATQYAPSTIGAAGAYSGYSASKNVGNYRGGSTQNAYTPDVRRRSPFGIIIAVIIVLILIGLIVWLIVSFFWCKNANQSSNTKQSCVGGSCTNSSDCQPGLTCSNGVCVNN